MRRGTEKRIRQRKMMSLTDLATNTRKRRRLARRLLKEEPLFAYEYLSGLIEDYSHLAFQRDTVPTKGSRKKGKKVYSNRQEFHDELLKKLDPLNPDNKIVTKLMLNWENIKKPMVMEFKRAGERRIFKCPRSWSLSQIRRTFQEMEHLKTFDEINSFWDKHNSYGG